LVYSQPVIETCPIGSNFYFTDTSVFKSFNMTSTGHKVKRIDIPYMTILEKMYEAYNWIPKPSDGGEGKLTIHSKNWADGIGLGIKLRTTEGGYSIRHASGVGPRRYCQKEGCMTKHYETSGTMKLLTIRAFQTGCPSNDANLNYIGFHWSGSAGVPYAQPIVLTPALLGACGLPVYGEGGDARLVLSRKHQPFNSLSSIQINFKGYFDDTNLRSALNNRRTNYWVLENLCKYIKGKEYHRGGRTLGEEEQGDHMYNTRWNNIENGGYSNWFFKA